MALVSSFFLLNVQLYVTECFLIFALVSMLVLLLTNGMKVIVCACMRVCRAIVCVYVERDVWKRWEGERDSMCERERERETERGSERK